MTFWAVVEDYDNGLTWEENYSYKNQLCGLFDIKKYAINHLKDGLDDEWIKNPVLTKGVSNIAFSKSCSHETLRRRVKEIEVGIMYPNVISDNILEDNCYY
jgi:hypothetical protein